MAVSPADIATSMQGSCGASTFVLYIALGLAGLVVAFTGYRLYTSFIMALGFVLFFGIEGASGMNWTAQASGAETEKRTVVLCFCLMWGLIGAFIFVRFVEKFQRVVGFIMGAVLGVVLLMVLILSARSSVDAELGPAYSGWEAFMTFSLGLPVALLFGYLLRNALKYAIMLVTAAGGAVFAIRSLMTLLECSESQQILEQTVRAVLMVVLAALGFATQFFTDAGRTVVIMPKSARAGPSMV